MRMHVVTCECLIVWLFQESKTGPNVLILICFSAAIWIYRSQAVPSSMSECQQRNSKWRLINCLSNVTKYTFLFHHIIIYVCNWIHMCSVSMCLYIYASNLHIHAVHVCYIYMQYMYVYNDNKVTLFFIQ